MMNYVNSKKCKIKSDKYGETKSFTEKKRNVNMDLVRIIAVFFVFSVHFCLYSGFYDQKIEGITEYFTIAARTLFMVCVPLFIILSGFLMNKKKLSKGYYKGIIKIIAVYILASIASLVFKVKYFGGEADIWQWTESIFNYSGISYSWYIELYIGLFLIIPFLNAAYHSFKSKKEKLILIFSFIAITSLPTVINYEYKVFPSYWVNFYPVTYYFIGAFLNEFGINIKKRYILLMLLLSLSVFAGFNYYRGSLKELPTFEWSIYCDWYGFENLVDSVLLFVLIQKLNLDKLPNIIKKILRKLSELTLGAYLLSYIFDTVFYKIFNSQIALFYDKLPYYFVIVPMIFICSMTGSFIIDLIIRIFKIKRG